MRIVLSLVLSVVLSGCAARMGDFTVMSTHNVELQKMGTYERGPRSTGENIAQIYLFIPTKFQPNIEDAIDDAIQKVPGGVAMVDVVVRQYSWWFLYGEAGWVVEGTVLVDPALIRH